jgi:hypothetical protein
MKTFLYSLLLLFSFFSSTAQTTTTSDRTVIRQSMYLRNKWVDSIQNDTNFIFRTNAVPTSDAVSRFINSRVGSYVPYSAVGANNGVASLDPGGKVPYSQLPASLMIYKGIYDPVTNTPVLSDATGVNGWVYKVASTGSHDFGSGAISFYAGDFVIHNGTAWEKSVGTDNVVSVNGQQGVVSIPNVTGYTQTYNSAAWYVNLQRYGSTDIQIPLVAGTATTGDYPFFNGANLAFNSKLRSIQSGSNFWITYNGDTLVTNKNTAPLTGSGNYIQNQFASAQTAEAWLSGRFRARSSRLDTLFFNNTTSYMTNSGGGGIVYTGGYLETQNGLYTTGGGLYARSGIYNDLATTVDFYGGTTGQLKIVTAPTSSAGSYDLITRNTSTGLVEKVASSVLTQNLQTVTNAGASTTNNIVVSTSAGNTTIKPKEVTTIDAVTSNHFTATPDNTMVTNGNNSIMTYADRVNFNGNGNSDAVRLYGITPATGTTNVYIPARTSGGTDTLVTKADLRANSSGITTVGAINSTSTANAATVSGTTLALSPADGTNGGILTNGTQSIAGWKKFQNSVQVKDFSIGQNSGSGGNSGWQPVSYIFNMNGDQSWTKDVLTDGTLEQTGTVGSEGAKWQLKQNGQLVLPKYGSSTTITGTANKYAAFDASGQMIPVAPPAAGDGIKRALFILSYNAGDNWSTVWNNTGITFTFARGGSAGEYVITPSSSIGSFRTLKISNVSNADAHTNNFFVDSWNIGTTYDFWLVNGSTANWLTTTNLSIFFELTIYP